MTAGLQSSAIRGRIGIAIDRQLNLTLTHATVGGGLSEGMSSTSRELSRSPETRPNGTGAGA